MAPWSDATPDPRSGSFAETPETRLLRETLDPDLKAAVDALPAAFRQAVWLRDVEEFSYAEIAQMLAIPVGTVMSRISRGRRMLFDRLSVVRGMAAVDERRDVESPEIEREVASGPLRPGEILSGKP